MGRALWRLIPVLVQQQGRRKGLTLELRNVVHGVVDGRLQE